MILQKCLDLGCIKVIIAKTTHKDLNDFAYYYIKWNAWLNFKLMNFFNDFPIRLQLTSMLDMFFNIQLDWQLCYNCVLDVQLYLIMIFVRILAFL